MTLASRAVLVVPCFNEAHRLDEHSFLGFLEAWSEHLAEPAEVTEPTTCEVSFLFVDDGSTDGTDLVLERLARKSPAISVMSLAANAGKAEAVRQGLLRAIDSGAQIVGYIDADLATPLDEVGRLLRTIEADEELVGVLGARVARLGSRIERSAWRHYLGRIFATFASLALGKAVYDTQCGAKLFRVSPVLARALAEPFRNRWSFDVALLQRLFDGVGPCEGIPEDKFLEMPLNKWRDRPGSKVSAAQAVAAFVDVVLIGARRWMNRGSGRTWHLGRGRDKGETTTR